MSTLEFTSEALTVAGFFLAAYGAWMVYRQHRYQILMDLHKELLGEEMQKSIRLVFSLNRKSIQEPDESQLVHIERVLGVYDLIGLRTKQGAIKRSHLLASEWRIVLPLWFKVKPFVKKQRALRRCDVYKEFFEWLVREANIYRFVAYGKPKALPSLLFWLLFAFGLKGYFKPITAPRPFHKDKLLCQ
jgi:hypothetical protein